MSSGRGTFIAFATAPGKTASDNPKGIIGSYYGNVVKSIVLRILIGIQFLSLIFQLSL